MPAQDLIRLKNLVIGRILADLLEEILVLIDKKDSYIYDINNFLTN